METPTSPPRSTGGVKVGALKPGDLLTLKSAGSGSPGGRRRERGEGRSHTAARRQPDGPRAALGGPDKVLLREFCDAESHQDWAASQKTGGGGGGAGGSVSAGDRAATSPASYSPASDRLDHLQDAAHVVRRDDAEVPRHAEVRSHSGFGEISHAARDSEVKMTAAQHAKLAALDRPSRKRSRWTRT